MNSHEEDEIVAISLGGWIDDACDRFEAAWLAGSVPNISEFFRSIAADQSGQQNLLRTLLEELIKIDLDHRWRRYRDQAADLSEKSPQSSVPRVSRPNGHASSDRPWLEDYAHLFTELSSLDELSVSLIAEEYRARIRWGDRPTAAEYAQRFPRHGQELVAALREVDAQWIQVGHALQIRIYLDGQLVHSDILPSPVELGRQQPDESGPYCKSTRGHGWRLVIASTDEDTVSRRHLRLELLPDGQLHVTNLSSSRSISLQNSGKLAAKDVCTAALPVLIMLGARTIRVQQK